MKQFQAEAACLYTPRVIRASLVILLLVLIPTAVIAMGIAGIVTGHFTLTRHSMHRHIAIDGPGARVLASSAVFGGAAILRFYWMVLRGPKLDTRDPIMLACLVLVAAALVGGMIIFCMTAIV